MFNDRNSSQCIYSLFLVVRPDPPAFLNWTLLNVSPSGISYDVMVNWEPPPSADVRAGWMRIEYEIQYRERNSTNWEAVSLQFSLLPLSPFLLSVDTQLYVLTSIYTFKTSQNASLHMHKLTQMQTLMHPLKRKL